MRELSLKKIALTVLAFCVGFVLLALTARYVAKYREADSIKAEKPYPIKRHLQYSYSLRNETNRVLEKAEFWTYGPVQMTATQKCERLDADHPFELIVDDLGNQVLHFTLQNLAPFATKLIRIQADVELSASPHPAPRADLPIFLKAEPRIEADSPEIIGLAKQLKGRNTLSTAESTFRWVAENLRYSGYSANDRGALYALRKKQGDCTEYMSLFVALCRANGIPARGIGGYVCPANMILKPNDYHNWAEFYENGTWQLADPQKKAFRNQGETYIAMRIISTSSVTPMGDWHRFRIVGEGLKVKMES